MPTKRLDFRSLFSSSNSLENLIWLALSKPSTSYKNSFKNLKIILLTGTLLLSWNPHFTKLSFNGHCTESSKLSALLNKINLITFRYTIRQTALTMRILIFHSNKSRKKPTNNFDISIIRNAMKRNFISNKKDTNWLIEWFFHI